MSALLAALAVRVAATAGVVILVALLVERLGARVGGVVAGLPIVVGPGLAFLAAREGDGFVGDAAVFALVSLVATQGFVLGYAFGARRGGPWRALAAAFLCWAAVGAALFGAPLGPWTAFAAFVAAALAVGALIGRMRTAQPAPPSPGGWLPLALRGALAGLLVGATTLAAAALGPRLAGLLLAFPVGMTVIAATIHARQGAATVIATLHAAAQGTLSIAVFALVVALAAAPLGAAAALALALAASLAATGLMLALQPRRRPRDARSSTPPSP